MAALSVTGILVALIGGYMIYKAAPYEIKTYTGRQAPWTRRWALRLFLASLLITAPAGYFLMSSYGPGALFIILGVGMIPAGVLAYIDDVRVSKLEQEVATFVRGLGNITSALGSTLGVGLEHLDQRSMGTLEPYVRRLQFRLGRRLSPDVCWDLFRDETGSELVNRATRMLVDGVKLGGKPEQVGEIAADYALSISLLRARRAVTASTFAFLTIPLHAAMISLLIFILEVVEAFDRRLLAIIDDVEGNIAAGASMPMPALPMFQPKDLSTVSFLLFVVIAALTIVDSFVPRLATGGHPMKVVFYGSIMLSLTGAAILLVPPLVSGVLG